MYANEWMITYMKSNTWSVSRKIVGKHVVLESKTQIVLNISDCTCIINHWSVWREKTERKFQRIISTAIVFKHCPQKFYQKKLMSAKICPRKFGYGYRRISDLEWNETISNFWVRAISIILNSSFYSISKRINYSIFAEWKFIFRSSLELVRPVT